MQYSINTLFYINNQTTLLILSRTRKFYATHTYFFMEPAYLKPNTILVVELKAFPLPYIFRSCNSTPSILDP